MSLPFRGLAITALLAGAAACADSLGSERGTYVLRTVGDSTLPFVEYTSATERTTALADTLTLDGRGGARETNVVRREVAGQAPAIIPWTSVRRYVVHGDTVEYVSNCPPGAMCPEGAGPPFALAQGGLTTYFTAYGPGLGTFEKIR